jgi:hypothetical protein
MPLRALHPVSVCRRQTPPGVKARDDKCGLGLPLARLEGASLKWSGSMPIPCEFLVNLFLHLVQNRLLVGFFKNTANDNFG